MENDVILEIGINSEEQLYIKPSTAKFPYMYREALEVHWNQESLFLYSPKPKKWSYLEWYKHIISAAEIQSFKLNINKETSWVNVPPQLKMEILSQCH